MLTINVDGIDKNVKPEIKNNKKYLESATNIISSISIPSDFLYYSRLKSFPSSLSEIEKRVNSIGKWIDECIGNFTKVESSNKNIMNSVISAIPSLNLNINLATTGANIGSMVENSDFLQDAKTIVSNAVDYIISGDFILDTKKFAKETASEVASNVKSKISLALATGAEFFDNVKTTILSKVDIATEFVGTKITSACEYVYDNILSPVILGIEKVGASIANFVIGIIKGLAELVQALINTVVIIRTCEDMIYTGIWDLGNYISIVLTDGNTDEFSSVTKKLWESTMGFVAEDYVGNAFCDFYQNTMIGQVLDEYAFSPFKSDGMATNIASGLGYVAGIIIISIATLGIGDVALGVGALSSTAVTAGVATLSGFGKYTGEEWAELRDSSWEGIKRLYENGDITEEQYNSYVYIKNLTLDEWNKIKEDYKNGKISQEQFELMKQIRYMPEDWTTLENGLKGLGYGTANGVWEGIQWYLGGKLGDFAIEGSKVASSAVRVGADSAFNAADTPFRALMDSVVSGKNYEEAWVEQGGWTSLLTNLGIGLIGSVGGEFFNKSKLSMEDNIELSMEDKMKLAQRKMSKFFKKNLNLGISKEQLDKAFKKIIPCTNNDAFMNIARQLTNWTDQELADVAAFHSSYNGGTIVLRPSNSIETIIHEVNHALGEVYMPYVGVLKAGTDSRGINEALTESLALKIAGITGDGVSGYAVNVAYINKIVKLLEDAGYTDIDAISYYTDKTAYLANTINQIVGDTDFYDELVQCMNIADGWGDIKDIIEVKQANISVQFLIDILEKKIGEKMYGR